MNGPFSRPSKSGGPPRVLRTLLVLLPAFLIGLGTLTFCFWYFVLKTPRRKESTAEHATGILSCRLIPEVRTIDGRRTYLVQLEVSNHGLSAVDIPYDGAYWPYEHLSLQITNPTGQELLSFRYEELKSVIGPPKTLRIDPWSTYSVRLNITNRIHEIDPPLTKPEICMISGSFEYDNTFVPVPPVELPIDPEEKD
jgi:hypothetical protein